MRGGFSNNPANQLSYYTGELELCVAPQCYCNARRKLFSLFVVLRWLIAAWQMRCVTNQESDVCGAFNRG